MTRDETHFKSWKIKDGDKVAFRGEDKRKIVGIINDGKTSSNSIENVLLIKRLN